MTVLPPRIIYWLMSTGTVLTSLPRAVDVKKSISRPWIPLGATHWRIHPLKDWSPMSEFPAKWGLSRVSKVEHEEGDEMNEAELQQWRARQKGKS